MSGWLVLALVLLLLALLAVGLFLWWRSKGGEAVRAFYLTVRQMEQDQDVVDRYEVPWFLLLGDPLLGERFGLDWGLTAAGRPAWFGRWWADQDGAVLAVPPSLFLAEEGAATSPRAWRRLLSLLLRLRPRRPLDGVVWVLPVQRLLDPASLAQENLQLRRRFNDLLQRLGLSLPVYVVVTGLEELEGFAELRAQLPEDARERPLGWSSAVQIDAAWQDDHLERGFEQVLQALQASILEAGVLKGQLSDALYRFPIALASLRDGLRQRLGPVFQGNALGEAPRLRGLYFSGACRNADSDPWSISALEAAPAQQVFTRGLWQSRLLAERGLAQAVSRILRLRQRSQRVMGAVAGVVGVGWLLGMLWVWHVDSKEAQVLGQRIQAMQREHGDTAQGGEPSSDMARRRLQGYWSLLQGSSRWHFSSLVYPSSWFSDFDSRMDALLRDLARREVLLPLQQSQVADLARLKAIRSTERRANVQSDSPEQWPNFVAARDLATGVLAFEQRNRWYTELRAGTAKNALESLAKLGNEAYGLSLDPAGLRDAGYLEAVLGEGIPGAPVAVDPGPKDGPLARNFRELMGLWLDQFFLADNFVRPAGFLRLHLNELKARQGNRLEELEETGALVDALRNMVELTNAAWSHGNAQEIVPGYRALLDDARQSYLLGPAVESAVVSQANKLQRAFHDQWIAAAGSRDNLLQLQPGGTLMLQDHVVALGSAIDSLLRQDFAGTALRQQDSVSDPRGLGSLDAHALNTALAYYDSYRKYREQEQARVPAEYRDALAESAAAAAASAMWASLTESAAPSVASTASAFDVPLAPAEQLREAFDALQRKDLASALDAHLTRSALANVDQALATINALPLFRVRNEVSAWDGSRNFGLQLYRSADTQDLKRTLNQQFETMLAQSETHAPALAWLRGRSNLGFADQDKVRRFSDLNDELTKYKAQNPTSSPMLLDQLLSRDFIEMDASSCAGILKTSTLVLGQGDLARFTRSLHDQAQQRCLELQQKDAAAAWAAIADYFDQYLANRFPFAYSLQAEDADPARVQHFVELLDQHLQRAQAGLQVSQSADRVAAADFLARLQLAKAWLGPLFVRDKGGAQGVDLDVRWRTDREAERGADQVIVWNLYAADRQLSFPGTDGQRLHWSVGEPVKLMLRWAKDSPQRPDIDPQQPSMAVADLEAGWEYDGPWALLRLLRSHVTLQRQPSTDYTDFPLALQVPVRVPNGRAPDARLFVRVSLMTQDAKQPLSIQPLPVRAPRTPFSGVGIATFAGTQESP